MRPGDVVVYRKGAEYIVHRVRSLGPDGIHARGDNNRLEDEAPIPAEQILGVVDQADEGGILRPVRGGPTAFWSASLRWKAREIFQKMLPWLGAPYRWLKARQWIPRIWHPQIIKVSLRSANGGLIKYLVRGKVVATWQPGNGRFICRRPYDLVIPSPQNEPDSLS